VSHADAADTGVLDTAYPDADPGGSSPIRRHLAAPGDCVPIFQPSVSPPASAPIFVQFLTSLSAVLDKAAAHAEAKKIDPASPEQVIESRHAGQLIGKAARRQQRDMPPARLLRHPVGRPVQSIAR
jgi:hypothetical protein